MAEHNGGVDVEVSEGEETKPIHRRDDDDTLFGVVNRLLCAILFPGPDDSGAPLFRRIKTSVAENAPRFREASRNTGRSVLVWTRQGSPLRPLLVISVGTITLLGLTGLLVFMLFFLAATFNAIVLSLLLSLAAAGGFLALFFTFIAAIYIGALSVAIFVVSATTISAIVAVLITTGWIGFFWCVWLASKKCLSLAQRSLSVTGSTISAYSYGRHAHKASG
ncbi:uncharacterized protein LOC126791920 [Argentina anserina]|uniref:uncharacterized protein LOC126791920 n=1 Tax=Argentina anserina TaxID=57926 RepID=UPI0021767AF0|nr:uncharacterized protein LOC126791920 [Potentilla anserina]